MDIVIKPMETEEEMLGKAYVHYTSWQETYAGLIDAEYLAGITLEKCEKIARKWPDHLLVAKEGERVIGFAGYGPYRDDTMPGCGEVYAIYVLRQYHGQGVGPALMQEALARLTDYDRVAVWVLRGNERAIRFYEKCGFRFDGTELPVMMGTENGELRMILNRKNPV